MRNNFLFNSLIFGIILLVILSVISFATTIENQSILKINLNDIDDIKIPKSNNVIYLNDIDSGLTSPTGDYRWLDIANQSYSTSYQNNYNYTQANVEITYNEIGETFQGIMNASTLKPNFAYQLKLVGTSGTSSNELIGLAGRWWQEEWNGTTWTNGWNLNDKGDGSSPNPNDDTYFTRKNITNVTSPTGLKYKYTGYLVFDYFTTDEYGNISLNFEANSSYHVLWTTGQRNHTGDDGPLKTSSFDADLSDAYDDIGGDDFPLQNVSIFGEWERLPVGGVYPQHGEYDVQIIITEESFHGMGGSLSGNWAGAMGAQISFSIHDVYVDDDADIGWYDATHVRTIQEGVDNASVGDTVFVYNGTYYENVVINKIIDLIGENKDTTIINGNNGYGITVQIINVDIDNFTLINSNCGIFVEANYCEITNIKAYAGYKGIEVQDVSNTIITGCNLSNNSNIGITIKRSYDTLLDNCIIEYNLGIGVNFVSSDSNIISNSRISNNGNYGIRLRSLEESNGNIIHNNILIMNGVNAFDECSNTWYNTTLQEGNYWDDYTGNDIYHGPNQDIPGSDGIGDTPYDIPGGSNQDLYPLMNSYNPWNARLNFTSTNNYTDYVVFGERPGAMDGQDSWDAPKPGIPPTPYIFAWFDANLSTPYTKLWHDYRYYPDTLKIWDLYFKCDTTEPTKGSTNITISWNTDDINESEYNHVELYEYGNPNPMADMKTNNTYIFNATFSSEYHFQIKCIVNRYNISLSDRWNIISAPCYDSISKTDIIVENNSIEYSWDEAVSEGVVLNFLYNFNRTSHSYEFSDTIEPGYGYWLWSNYDCELIIYSNKVGTGHITDLESDWNIMGLPYNDTISKTSIYVTNNIIDYTWNEAVSEGIILNFVYGWNNTNQLYEFSDNFEPGHGYWMYAYYDCTLKRV